MKRIGIFVGGSPLPTDGETMDVSCTTPWGAAAEQPRKLRLGETELFLMRRHGEQHQTNPHQINYRANVWLFNALGVDAIVGTHTVGSIDAQLRVGDLVLPTQLIDYTWGRQHTFDDKRRHVDFSQPYDDSVRERIVQSGVDMFTDGVHAVTQGPRLETAAEIKRIGQDGCTIVGMTGMPEAGLARELEVPYASVCVVINPGAGLSAESIDLAALRRASLAGANKIWSIFERLGS